MNVFVRLTDEEAQALKKASERAKLTPLNMIRHCLVTAGIIPAVVRSKGGNPENLRKWIEEQKRVSGD